MSVVIDLILIVGKENRVATVVRDFTEVKQTEVKQLSVRSQRDFILIAVK